jgi:peptidoglycan/LPS O-acetylase OafA/YrhL
MFGNRRLSSSSLLFADQFEPEGPDFLYRKSMRGPPIRVTAAEREAFVEAHGRRMRYVTWGAGALMMLLIIVQLYVWPGRDRVSEGYGHYVTVVILVLFILAGHRWSWNAPARELERRTPVGLPRSRREARQLALSRISYGHLALAGVGVPLYCWSKAEDGGLVGWNIFWLLVAIAFVTLAALQAVRKWQSEREA